MDVLLPVFVAVLLSETGGRVQARAHLLSQTFGTGGAILAALSLSTMLSLFVAGIGGGWIAETISFQARTLLAGLALLFAGLPMFLAMKAPKAVGGKAAFPAALGAFLPVQFGDASQFIVFAMAARTDQPALGIAAGLVATLVSAAFPLMMARDWPGVLPLALLRRVAAVLLTLAGAWMIVSALRLV